MLRNKKRDRRGAILAAALAVMFVVIAIAGILLRGFTNGRRQLRKLRRHDQIQWVVTATIQREIQVVKADPDYEGRSWQVTQNVDGAEREIRITTKSDPIEKIAGQRTLSVRGELIQGRDRVEITVEKKITVIVPNLGETQ